MSTERGYSISHPDEENNCRGRPSWGWMDGVTMALGVRSMSVEQGRLKALDRRRSKFTVRSE